MSMIKNCFIATSNGNVVGMHPTQEAASQQVLEIAEEWQRHADCGSEVPAPKLAVLSFNSWMQLQQWSVDQLEF